MRDTHTSAVKKSKNANPLQTGILAFLSRLQPTRCEALTSKDVPKRYTRYGTLLLMGPTFTAHSDLWSKVYRDLSESEKFELFRSITTEFGQNAVTHVAMNAPITQTISGESKVQNIMRSPVHLLPLFGDFGPAFIHQEADAKIRGIRINPSNIDFDAAYWTETSQLNGIIQVWAPRWTMFSRGNIGEKARILGTNQKGVPFAGLSESALGEPVNEIDAVDFYIGIGYFAFCYLTRGVRRVWGSDINGWSIEGLRRGCMRNGWGIKVIKLGDHGEFQDGETVENLINEIVHRDTSTDPIRCVAFLGDNRWIKQILHRIRVITEERNLNMKLNVRHCNLGLLPTSDHSWSYALQTIAPPKASWLHIHENVEVGDVEKWEGDVTRALERMVKEKLSISWTVECEQTHQVKSYAPGVMHCVYDYKLSPMK